MNASAQLFESLSIEADSSGIMLKKLRGGLFVLYAVGTAVQTIALLVRLLTHV